MATEIRARAEGFGIGFWVAVVLLIAVWLGFLFGRVDLPLAFVVSGLCAIRL